MRISLYQSSSQALQSNQACGAITERAKIKSPKECPQAANHTGGIAKSFDKTIPSKRLSKTQRVMQACIAGHRLTGAQHGKTDR